MAERPRLSRPHGASEVREIPAGANLEHSRGETPPREDVLPWGEALVPSGGNARSNWAAPAQLGEPLPRVGGGPYLLGALTVPVGGSPYLRGGLTPLQAGVPPVQAGSPPVQVDQPPLQAGSLVVPADRLPVWRSARRCRRETRPFRWTGRRCRQAGSPPTPEDARLSRRTICRCRRVALKTTAPWRGSGGTRKQRRDTPRRPFLHSALRIPSSERLRVWRCSSASLSS
jgi:hypothetical protein